MDFVAHAFYGATVFSRSGLAGGLKGARRTFVADWTVWVAMLFGLLPDAVSMGLPFLSYWGEPRGHFFRDFSGSNLELYRYVHSLLVAFAACGILRLVWRPLWVPSLAWPLHLLMDSLTHHAGKFGTTLFYPLTDWAYEGWPWWHHNGVFQAYWLLLPVMWAVLWLVRRGQRRAPHRGP